MTVRDLTPDSSRSAGDFSAIRPQVAAKCMHAALWRFAKTLLSTSAMQGLRVRHALLRGIPVLAAIRPVAGQDERNKTL